LLFGFFSACVKRPAGIAALFARIFATAAGKHKRIRLSSPS
jgi:hypothetical protein